MLIGAGGVGVGGGGGGGGSAGKLHFIIFEYNILSIFGNKCMPGKPLSHGPSIHFIQNKCFH